MQGLSRTANGARRRGPARRALLTALTALLSASGAVAQPFPPRAAPALGLAQATPTDADFPRPFDTPLPLLLKTAEGPKRVEAVNCRDWLAHRARAIGSDNDAAWRVVRVQVMPCEAMALLARAGTAAQSALPERIDRELDTARYPATLWPAPSADEQRRLATAGMTLGRASGAPRWQPAPQGGTLTLTHGRWRVHLTLLARGDFDGDGWEDAAFAWQAEALQGSYADAQLVVLTRVAGDTALRTVAVGPMLAAASAQNRK